MGVGSLSRVHFVLVEQVSLDQPKIHYLLDLGWLIWLTEDQPVCAVLQVSYAGFLVNIWSGHQLVTHYVLVGLEWDHL